MGLYSGGIFIYQKVRIIAFEIWGAYFREGLFLERLIIGILRYFSTFLTKSEQNPGDVVLLSNGG